MKQDIRISQNFVASGDLELWTESFGEPRHPAVLLIMGAWNQGIVWPDEFCTEIAQHGYYVIRYDHRDTGQSSSVDFQMRPYSLNELTQDAVAVLDGHGVHQAHIIGMSMGGFIGQLLALDYPDRVLTLTLLMTSPDQQASVRAILGKETIGDPLPPPSPRLLAHLARMRRSLPRSVEQGIRDALESWRIANGEDIPFDERWTRRLLERTSARVKNSGATLNHTLAMAASPGRTERLPQIAVPTLVIHGEHDPMLPLDHGRAVAEAIPGAKLDVIPDMGHMLSPRLCGRIGQMILEHLRG